MKMSLVMLQDVVDTGKLFTQQYGRASSRPLQSTETAKTLFICLIHRLVYHIVIAFNVQSTRAPP